MLNLKRERSDTLSFSLTSEALIFEAGQSGNTQRPCGTPTNLSYTFIKRFHRRKVQKSILRTKNELMNNTVMNYGKTSIAIPYKSS